MKTLKFAAILLAATTASFTFTSCDKEDDDAPVTPVTQETKTDLLTSSQWKGEDILLNGQSTKNHPSGFFDYITAERYTFNKNGTFSFTDSTGGSYNGVWAFIANETKLGLYTNASKADGDTADISVLTKDALGLKYTEDFGGTPVTMDNRYKH